MLGVKTVFKRVVVTFFAVCALPLAASAEEVLVPLDEAVVFESDAVSARVKIKASARKSADNGSLRIPLGSKCILPNGFV